MAKTIYQRKMGWLPDYPDIRDYTQEHSAVSPILGKVVQTQDLPVALPLSADLRTWCSPVEDQEKLGACTANAAAGLVEYFERRAFGKHIDASRLFLYKTTRNLLRLTGDTGAFLRSTIGALVLFGVPPEEYWPYEIDKFDEEPPVFCYSFAHNFRTISYFRLDSPGTSPHDLLGRIKSNLASGIPSVFGFTVYNSIEQAERDGKIPFPAPGEKMLGGHAVMAAGYDDKMTIRNKDGDPTTGAFLIRNSWGESWGEDGYGWLPYEYVLRGLGVDWWSVIKAEWVDTGMFGG